MSVGRGEIWLANLDPTRGSGQDAADVGTRPVLIFQNDAINKATTTVLVVPLTKDVRRAKSQFCVEILEGEGGLTSDSVALCHQLRVLDKTRLMRKLGAISPQTISAIEGCVRFTTGMP